ncbi:proline-rich transmembrane protein 4 [Rhinophrynus dorsalis]
MTTTTLDSLSPSYFVSSKPALPSFWPSTKQTTTDSQLAEGNTSNLGKMDATGGPQLRISEEIPGEFLDFSSEADGQLTEQMNEEPSSSPLSSEGKTDTSDAASKLLGSTPAVESAFLDCNYTNQGHCDFTMTPSLIPHEMDPTLHGHSSLLLSPPIFITLHSDWNTSVADWGIAWEALVYGSVGLFGSVALLPLLSLFCLIFRCPSGSQYFAVLHLLLIFVGSSRAFSLFYDAYGHQDRLPVFTAMILHDLAFPCMTSSFSIVFLLLSSRCRMQHSVPSYPCLCILAAAAFLHFVVSVGAVMVVHLLQQFHFLLLVSRGVYVLLSVFLSLSFFIFCCIARAQNTQIYDLKSSTPPTEYRSGCPFANSKDWSRASHIVLVSAWFALLNAGLQLYAMLHVMGYGGSFVFGPWPWWAFQLSSSLCEVGICLPLAVVGSFPIFCPNEMGRTNCWAKLFHLSPGHVTMKAPILPTNSQWASSQHEKLLICDTIVRSDSEFFPLYTLVEKRLSLGEDLSLIYHSSKSLEVQGLSLHNGSKTPSFISVQVDSDSTVDFRPPSPINLRRSIDEALFSEALIPKSLFHGTALSSSLSLTIKSATQLEECVFKEKASDRGLYRTSSCMEMETGLSAIQPTPATSRQENTSSPCSGVWRGGQSITSSLCKMSQDGSSLVLCSSSENVASSAFSAEKKQEFSRQSKVVYQSLSPPSQESLDITAKPENTLNDDFIDVFGPIDALSVGSDTIDL